MRYNLFNCVQINASAAPGYSSAQVMAALEDVFHKTMPGQMGFDYSGMSYQEQKAAQGVSPAIIFGLAFFVVFLIMAAQYESWTLPFSVLLGRADRSLRGVLRTLLPPPRQQRVRADRAGHADRPVGQECHSHRGVCQDRVRQRQAAHRRDSDRRKAETAAHPDDCICLHSGLRAVVERTGAGAISRQVLGTVVIGGMLASSIIAIFFVPVSFDVVERLSTWGKKESPPASLPAASGSEGD